MIKCIPQIFRAYRCNKMLCNYLPSPVRAKYSSYLSNTTYRFSCQKHQQQNILNQNVKSQAQDSTKEDMKQLPLNQQNIPKQYLRIQQQETKVGNQQIVAFHTKQTISILDRVPGTKKSESGQLYVLKFTCAKCETKSIRSFTKKAYHQGVVLIRCQGCENIHLVADNLGWFDDKPINIQTMSKDGVQKVHDPVAIAKFLKAAFGNSQDLKIN